MHEGDRSSDCRANLTLIIIGIVPLLHVLPQGAITHPLHHESGGVVCIRQWKKSFFHIIVQFCQMDEIVIELGNEPTVAQVTHGLGLTHHVAARHLHEFIGIVSRPDYDAIRAARKNSVIQIGPFLSGFV
jgi:hypothetical protein